MTSMQSDVKECGYFADKQWRKAPDNKLGFDHKKEICNGKEAD